MRACLSFIAASVPHTLLRVCREDAQKSLFDTSMHVRCDSLKSATLTRDKEGHSPDKATQDLKILTTKSPSLAPSHCFHQRWRALLGAMHYSLRPWVRS